MGSAQFYVDDKKLFIEAITGEKADNLIDYPQYLKNQYSNTEGVVDFSNWQVGFGRKFNSLRIYWVIRRFGILGMQEYINTIIKTSDYVVEKVKSISYLDLFVKKTYALSCFRVMRYPDNKPFESLEKQNEFNLNLVEEINKNGFMFLSKAINNGMNFIRFNLGSYDTTKKDIDDSFEYFDKYYKLLYKKEVKPSHF